MSPSDDRDPAIEQLLRQSFQDGTSEVTESCLDPETLAAWTAGGLTGRELAIAQSHAADCVRCQAVLATLARNSWDKDQVLHDQPAPVPKRWLGWLVPLTAVAAAMAIWIAVPRTSVAPTEAPLQNRAPSPDAERKTLETPAAKDQPPPEAQADQRVALNEKSNAAPAEPDDANKKQAAQAESRKDVEPLARDRARREESSALAASNARELQAAAAPAVAAEKPAANQKVDALAVVGQWRLSGFALERSTNGGASWEAAATGVATPLTAISAPSANVCWAVGRGGVVIRTTDGRTFTRLSFPETSDLTAIQATDARSAAVTTANGRTFATADAGATWK